MFSAGLINLSAVQASYFKPERCCVDTFADATNHAITVNRLRFVHQPVIWSRTAILIGVFSYPAMQVTSKSLLCTLRR